MSNTSPNLRARVLRDRPVFAALPCGQRAAIAGFTSPKSLPGFQWVFPDESASLLADERLQCCAGDRGAGKGADLRRAVRWDV